MDISCGNLKVINQKEAVGNMGVTVKSFYKVIVMKVDIFESEIVEERHFGSCIEAVRFCEHVMSTSDNMTVMVRM